VDSGGARPRHWQQRQFRRDRSAEPHRGRAVHDNRSASRFGSHHRRDERASWAPLETSGHLGLRSYTVATLPSAATAARLIYVSDGTGTKRLAVSDGTNWRFPDGAVVS